MKESADTLLDHPPRAGVPGWTVKETKTEKSDKEDKHGTIG
jgi:hypothetical protein